MAELNPLRRAHARVKRAITSRYTALTRDSGANRLKNHEVGMCFDVLDSPSPRHSPLAKAQLRSRQGFPVRVTTTYSCPANPDYNFYPLVARSSRGAGWKCRVTAEGPSWPVV